MELPDLSIEPIPRSSTGRYHFDPNLLMQSRGDDTRWGGMNPSVMHERAHWLQFVGSSFGAAYMTLIQSEDLNLKEMFQQNAESDEFRSYVRSCVRNGRPVLPFSEVMANPAVERRIPEGARRYFRRIAGSRMFRRLLYDARNGWRRYDLVNWNVAFDSAIENLTRRFDDRTSVWQERTDPDLQITESPDPKPIIVASRELTTLDLMEAGAALAEISFDWLLAWNSSNGEGAGFEPLGPIQTAPVLDALANFSDTYRAAIDIALIAWSSLSDGPKKYDRANAIMYIAPTLSCCIDIALNPILPPLCRWRTQTWEEIYPPARFMAAVEAVIEVGLFTSFSADLKATNEDDFRLYRDSLLSVAGIEIPAAAANVTGIVPVDGRLLNKEPSESESESESDPISYMTQFDYLIWATASLQRTGRKFPLRKTLPALLFLGLETTFTLWEEGDDIALAAPLYRIGQSIGTHVRLADHAGVKLLLEVCVSWALDTIANKGQVADLSDIVPDADEPLVQKVREFLKMYTECPELSEHVTFTEFLPAQRAPMQLKLTTNCTAGYTVRRDEVVALDIAPLQERIEALRNEPTAGMRTFTFEIDGYHHDVRELWEIPEVIQYLRLFQESTPHWPWYLYLDGDIEAAFAPVMLFRVYGSSRFSSSQKETRTFIERAIAGLESEGRIAGAADDLIRKCSEDLISVIQASFEAPDPL